MMKNSGLMYIDELMKRYPQLLQCKDSIINAVELLIETYKIGNKLLVCVNGGSASDSEHIVGELMKGFICQRQLSVELASKINDKVLTDALQYGLPTISLVSHTSLSTEFSNDQLPTAVFAQQVLGYGKTEDVLMSISTSWNSLNCVYAAKVAKAIGVKGVSLTGIKDSN